MIGTVECVVLDCSEVMELAQFYQAVLGGDINRPDDRFDVDDSYSATLHCEGDFVLSFQRIEDYLPPQWFDPGRPQQSTSILECVTLTAPSGRFSASAPPCSTASAGHAPPSLPWATGIAPAPPIEIELPVARGELTYFITVAPEGGLALALEYATDLFDPDTIATWANRFTETLTAGVTDPDSKPWHTGFFV